MYPRKGKKKTIPPAIFFHRTPLPPTLHTHTHILQHTCISKKSLAPPIITKFITEGQRDCDLARPSPTFFQRLSFSLQTSSFNPKAQASQAGARCCELAPNCQRQPAGRQKVLRLQDKTRACQSQERACGAFVSSQSTVPPGA